MVAPVEIDQRLVLGFGPQAHDFPEKHVMRGMILYTDDSAVESGKRTLQYGCSGHLNIPARQFEALILRQSDTARKCIRKLLMRPRERIDGENTVSMNSRFSS